MNSALKLSLGLAPPPLLHYSARALYYGDAHYRRIKDILNAALDRPIHHAHSLIIQGQSYRPPSRRTEALLKTKAFELVNIHLIMLGDITWLWVVNLGRLLTGH